MPIETLEDIIEEIANQTYHYGGHSAKCTLKNLCRQCYTSELEARIRKAIRLEDIINKSELTQG